MAFVVVHDPLGDDDREADIVLPIAQQEVGDAELYAENPRDHVHDLLSPGQTVQDVVRGSMRRMAEYIWAHPIGMQNGRLLPVACSTEAESWTIEPDPTEED